MSGQLYNICNKLVEVTQPYGGKHNGVDFGARGKGDHVILAARSGYIWTAGWDEKGFGQYICEKLENGKYLYYGHMKKGSLKVKTGDLVKAGQPLGIMGSTGNSTGIHLHFEYRSPDRLPKSHKNPKEYLSLQTVEPPNPPVDIINKHIVNKQRIVLKPLLDNMTDEQVWKWLQTIN